MSGARAIGWSVGAPLSGVCGRALGAPKRWAATRAMSATSAIEATIQGTAFVVRSGANPSTTAPTGAPQWWQKRAPGVSGDAQLRQIAPTIDVPQLAQKRPSAADPHEGQVVVVGAAMGGM